MLLPLLVLYILLITVVIYTYLLFIMNIPSQILVWRLTIKSLFPNRYHLGLRIYY